MNERPGGGRNTRQVFGDINCMTACGEMPCGGRLWGREATNFVPESRVGNQVEQMSRFPGPKHEVAVIVVNEKSLIH